MDVMWHPAAVGEDVALNLVETSRKRSRFALGCRLMSLAISR